jgi:hypothetical protein
MFRFTIRDMLWLTVGASVVGLFAAIVTSISFLARAQIPP